MKKKTWITIGLVVLGIAVLVIAMHLGGSTLMPIIKNHFGG